METNNGKLLFLAGVSGDNQNTKCHIKFHLTMKADLLKDSSCHFSELNSEPGLRTESIIGSKCFPVYLKTVSHFLFLS